MERLGPIPIARQKVIQDIERFRQAMSSLSSEPCVTLENGIVLLNKVRSVIYEDLNQIPHEFTILRAAEWLVDNRKCSAETIWFWNARQTGTVDEPDLRGCLREAIVVSAEITTSPEPNGLIDTRMRNTLAKLSGMPGQKFYFTNTDAMCRRAKTKIAKANWPIESVRLVDLT